MFPFWDFVKVQQFTPIIWEMMRTKLHYRCRKCLEYFSLDPNSSAEIEICISDMLFRNTNKRKETNSSQYNWFAIWYLSLLWSLGVWFSCSVGNDFGARTNHIFAIRWTLNGDFCTLILKIRLQHKGSYELVHLFGTMKNR